MCPSVPKGPYRYGVGMDGVPWGLPTRKTYPEPTMFVPVNPEGPRTSYFRGRNLGIEGGTSRSEVSPQALSGFTGRGPVDVGLAGLSSPLSHLSVRYLLTHRLYWDKKHK